MITPYKRWAYKRAANTILTAVFWTAIAYSILMGANWIWGQFA